MAAGPVADLQGRFVVLALQGHQEPVLPRGRMRHGKRGQGLHRPDRPVDGQRIPQQLAIELHGRPRRDRTAGGDLTAAETAIDLEDLVEPVRAVPHVGQEKVEKLVAGGDLALLERDQGAEVVAAAPTRPAPIERFPIARRASSRVMAA